MKSHHATVVLVFTFFFLSSCVIMGYARHFMYEEAVQEFVAHQTSLRGEGMQKPMGWETHEYLGSPEGASMVADPVFQDEIYSLFDTWLEYSTEYGIEVLPSILEETDNDKWNLWDAYKKVTIFNYSRTILWSASNMFIQLAPSSEDDWGGSLAESIVSWESAGGMREGNWMEVYKKSPEYEAWLSTIFGEIADPRGRRQEDYNPVSMEDRYRDTTRVVELPLCSSLLQKDMLEIDRKMTEVAYKRYVIHTAEKDIIRTNMDAWIVKFGSSNFNYTATADYTLASILRMRWFPLRDLVIDTCIIMSFSVLSTFFTVKKILPRVEAYRNERKIKDW